MPRAPSHRHDPRKLSPGTPGPSPSERYVFTRESVREVDRLAVEEFAMPSVVLMENAARGCADVALSMLGRAFAAGRTPKVHVVCGPGNNGGDGYAIARLLHNAGCDITIHALSEPKQGNDAAINRTICERMQLAIQPIDSADALRDGDLVIDAILGTGLSSEVKGDAANVIQRINEAKRTVLAVDLPSGMDCDTGEPLGTCIKADHTATFVGEKQGFTTLEAQKLLGEVTVIDIGVPRQLVTRLGSRTESKRHQM